MPSLHRDVALKILPPDQKRLAHELESWERLSAAITMVARTTGSKILQ